MYAVQFSSFKLIIFLEVFLPLPFHPASFFFFFFFYPSLFSSLSIPSKLLRSFLHLASILPSSPLPPVPTPSTSSLPPYAIPQSLSPSPLPSMLPLPLQFSSTPPLSFCLPSTPPARLASPPPPVIQTCPFNKSCQSQKNSCTQFQFCIRHWWRNKFEAQPDAGIFPYFLLIKKLWLLKNVLIKKSCFLCFLCVSHFFSFPILSSEC